MTFIGRFILLFLLFGSAETYVLSWQPYGRPLEPAQFTNDHLNQDGLRGAVPTRLASPTGRGPFWQPASRQKLPGYRPAVLRDET